MKNKKAVLQLLIILAIIPFFGFSQGKDSTCTGKFSIGLAFSPDYCYRTLQSDASSQWIADGRNAMEVPKFGFTTGISGLYKLSKKVNIEAGLQYSDKGEKTKQYTPDTTQPSDPAIPNHVSYNYSYTYLDIPLKVSYSILTHRFGLFVSAGISTNIFLLQQTTATQEFADGTTKKVSSTNIVTKFSAVNFAILAGFGVDYNVNKSAQIRVEPIYRRSLNSIISAPIKEYLYSAGLNIEFYYKL